MNSQKQMFVMRDEPVGHEVRQTLQQARGVRQKDIHHRRMRRRGGVSRAAVVFLLLLQLIHPPVGFVVAAAFARSTSACPSRSTSSRSSRGRGRRRRQRRGRRRRRGRRSGGVVAHSPTTAKRGSRAAAVRVLVAEESSAGAPAQVLLQRGRKPVDDAELHAVRDRDLVPHLHQQRRERHGHALVLELPGLHLVAAWRMHASVLQLRACAEGEVIMMCWAMDTARTNFFSS